MTKPPVSIAVVDDHSLFRAGIIKLLNENDDISILFGAINGKDLQTKIQQYGLPEVVLMDVNMPVMDGCEATKWLKKEFPQAHVLALSMDEQENKVIKMIKFGAGGYLLKDSTTDEVVRGILTIAKNGSYLNEYVSGRLINNLRNDSNSRINTDNFTSREKEFIFYCCSEMTYKEIAVKMNISVKTVNNYREDIFEKLNLRNRVGLVLYAIKKGIVKVEDIPE